MWPAVALAVLLSAAAMPAVAAPGVAPGAELFAGRCAMCHQANGSGLPGQFPRLAGRVNVIAQAPSGRRYLALVLLNGMVGHIELDGQGISGLMPSVAALPDQDLADILNYVTRFGPPAKGKKPAVFTAAEIAGVRQSGAIGPTATGAERAKLVAGGVVP